MLPMGSLVEEVRAASQLPSPVLCRAIREAVRVTQQRIADELGVHRVTVARWEAGLRRPRNDLAVAYAGLLRSLEAAAR